MLAERGIDVSYETVMDTSKICAARDWDRSNSARQARSSAKESHRPPGAERVSRRMRRMSATFAQNQRRRSRRMGEISAPWANQGMPPQARTISPRLWEE